MYNGSLLTSIHKGARLSHLYTGSLCLVVTSASCVRIKAVTARDSPTGKTAVPMRQDADDGNQGPGCRSQEQPRTACTGSTPSLKCRIIARSVASSSDRDGPPLGSFVGIRSKIDRGTAPQLQRMRAHHCLVFIRAKQYIRIHILILALVPYTACTPASPCAPHIL